MSADSGEVDLPYKQNKRISPLLASGKISLASSLFKADISAMNKGLQESLLARRIRARLDALGVKASPTSVKAGFGKDFIAEVFRGEKRSISAENLAALARVLQAPTAYFTDENFKLPENGEPIHFPDSREERDVVIVPQIDLRFGMGGGTPFDEEAHANEMEFPRDWIRQFTSNSLSQLFFVVGAGDSMSPTIGDRDILLCDRSQTQPTMGDKIWAITQYGHGQIKRLRPTATGYLIMSDNQHIPPDIAADGSMEIIGRVIAIVRSV